MLKPKSQVRQEILNLRNKISDQQITSCSEKIANIFLTSDLYLNQHNNNIAIYFANNGEIDPIVIQKDILANEKHCYSPCVNNNQLIFQQIFNNTKFCKNKYNILEPKLEPNYQINPLDLDLVLTPLVAYDKFGNRIGMGKGYYDKSFMGKQKHKKPILIGLAYSWQQAPQIDIDEFDIKLDYVINENEIIKF